jgi:hypothetical protein
LTKDQLIKSIKNMEKRLEDRTFQGKISDYELDLLNLKLRLQALDNSELEGGKC